MFWVVILGEFISRWFNDSACIYLFLVFVQSECELRSYPSIVQRTVIFPITSSEASALIPVEKKTSLSDIATTSSFLQSIENLPTVFGSNPKAHIAAKTVFHLAHRHGDILREGWKNIMEAMLQLFRAELLPKAMVEVIISWLVDNWWVRGVGSWLFIDPAQKVGELSCKGLALVKCVQNLEACEGYRVQVMCSFFCSLFNFFSFYFLLDLRNCSIYFTWTDFKCCVEEEHAYRHEVLEHCIVVTRWEWHFTDSIVGWRAGFAHIWAVWCSVSSLREI